MAIQRLILDIEMSDGTTYENVRTTFADRVLYDKTARSQGWGKLEDNMLTFQGFLAYAALKRIGKFDGDFVAFTAQVADIGEAGSEDVNPTTATP